MTTLIALLAAGKENCCLTMPEPAQNETTKKPSSSTIIEGQLFTSDGRSQAEVEEEEELRRQQEKAAILAKQKEEKEAKEAEKRRKAECEDLIQEAVKLKNEEKYSDALKKLKKASAMDIPEKEEAIRNIKNEIEEQKNKNSLATRFGNWLNTILDENN